MDPLESEGGLVTNARAFCLFCLSVVLLVWGKAGLDEATRSIEQGIVRVPDLMGPSIAMGPGPGYLELLRQTPKALGLYREALWTYDVLFPLGFCGVCFVLIFKGPLPRFFRFLPFFVLAMDVGAENGTVSMVLWGTESTMKTWGRMWQYATAIKWYAIYICAPCAFLSALWIGWSILSVSASFSWRAMYAAPRFIRYTAPCALRAGMRRLRMGQGAKT